MRQEKIAFVHYPHFPKRARLETMSFSLNSVILLAKAGWHVDVFLWERPSLNYQGLLPNNVTIQYFKELPSDSLNRFQHFWLVLRLKLQKNSYCCVFGLGQIGAYIAAILAGINRCPFIYINDEFPSAWPPTSWASLEQLIVKTAVMVVLPDKQRFLPLCRELNLHPSTPYAVLPNIPLIMPSFEVTDWRKQLRIPVGTIPFLYAGGIGDWSQVPELLCSVPYWPKQAVLVLHGRAKQELEVYRQQLSHLDIPKKIIWSAEPMPGDRLNSLIAYCAGSFALYRNIGPNIEYVGFSSGKLMRSLACGSPVIASKLSSFEFISEYGLGMLVRHPREIPAAITQILHEQSAYKQRCVQFCATKASFAAHWEILCDKLESLTDIDLRTPKGSEI